MRTKTWAVLELIRVSLLICLNHKWSRGKVCRRSILRSHYDRAQVVSRLRAPLTVSNWRSQTREVRAKSITWYRFITLTWAVVEMSFLNLASPLLITSLLKTQLLMVTVYTQWMRLRIKITSKEIRSSRHSLPWKVSFKHPHQAVESSTDPHDVKISNMCLTRVFWKKMTAVKSYLSSSKSLNHQSQRSNLKTKTMSYLHKVVRKTIRPCSHLMHDDWVFP